MERNFRHPWGMYHGKETGPWFTGAGQHRGTSSGDVFARSGRMWGPCPEGTTPGRGMMLENIHRENNWRGRPFTQWRQDRPNPQWSHPKPQWDHFNSWQGENHQQPQYCPDPQWDQYHPEQSSRNYDFDNGNFPHRGRGSYRRRSHGRFYGKHSSNFFKGKHNSHSSSRVLVEMQQSKKKKESEVKKDESAVPKKTKQAQEDSIASVKQTDPSQVSLKSSKAIISPSQFSFRLPPDSLTSPVCSPEQTEDTDQIKLGISFKTDNSHQVTCCTQATTSELPTTLENLEHKKEDMKIELDKLKGTQAIEVQPNQAASLPSAETPMEGQIPSKTAGSFHPLVKEEPTPATEVHCSLVASFVSSEVSTGKQASSDTMKDSHPVVKEELDTEPHSCQAASLASDEAPIQASSKVTESIHPVAKEEPVLVPETNQNMNIASLTDHSSVTELSAPSCGVKPPSPVETREALCSLGKEEDELLESSELTEHIDSPPVVEIPFISEVTDECQSEGKEDLDQTQMGDSHEDTDCSQACDAVAGGSSALPAITSDVHSVPVLVSGKEIEQPYFWESLHPQTFNWSNVGKGWAPEDYQEPSWGVDEAKNSGDVSEPERNLVLPCTSLHSHYSSDRNPDTGRVLECRSSTPKSHHNSDSKHSSTQRTTKTPLRQGHHSRSPLRQRRHSRFPVRGREIIKKDYCSKCHCKCCQNSSQERFQERELPCAYSVNKMHHYHSSKETSKSYKKSHSFSAENSMRSQPRKKKLTHHEETKKGRSTSVKETKSSKSQPRKKKSAQCEETKKGRSTSVKETKSSKLTVKGEKVLNPINHHAALAVETSIPAETSEHSQSGNTEVSELVQLAPSSEETVFPHQPCAWKETGISAPSKIVEDPRSVAVLTKRNQIEQDYLQVVLNFAVVATMLLQKEPCMEQTLEVALRANMRSVGDYYESMLKNFIDNYDISDTH